MKSMVLLLSLFGLLAPAACDRNEPDVPPTIRLGRDECGECGMAIHEERSSAALLVERDGRREYVLFDDIGCFLNTLHTSAPELKAVHAFVHDYSNKAWISASTANFLLSGSTGLRTPMGSGIAAFTHRADAENMQKQVGGEIVDYKSVVAWHSQRMNDRSKAAGR
ncbi:MAG: nitrous oxide reductase accessory protein NosL [Phycisphaerae bacterium]|nr:nitrous oxide reductase accessory protein NosL [Phycisphaerae bacterium]